MFKPHEAEAESVPAEPTEETPEEKNGTDTADTGAEEPEEE